MWNSNLHAGHFSSEKGLQAFRRAQFYTSDTIKNTGTVLFCADKIGLETLYVFNNIENLQLHSPDFLKVCLARKKSLHLDFKAKLQTYTKRQSRNMHVANLL